MEGHPLHLLTQPMKLKALTRSSLFRISLVGLSALAIASCRTESAENSIPSSPSPAADAGSQAATATATAPVTCETANYYAEVSRNGEQSVMTFARKPDVISVNQAPVSSKANSDGSTTFGVSGESTFYARIFPNGTCFLQVVGTDGTVALEENGQLRQ